jgi:hypothetical protein
MPFAVSVAKLLGARGRRARRSRST